MVKHPQDRAQRMAVAKKKLNEKKKANSIRQRLKDEIKAQETKDELKQYSYS